MDITWQEMTSNQHVQMWHVETSTNNQALPHGGAQKGEIPGKNTKPRGI